MGVVRSNVLRGLLLVMLAGCASTRRDPAPVASQQGATEEPITPAIFAEANGVSELVASRRATLGSMRAVLHEAVRTWDFSLSASEDKPQQRERVGGPWSPLVDDVRTLITVSVRSGGDVLVGGAHRHGAVEIEEAARSFASQTAPILFLVRADDSATFGDLFDTARALRRGGVGHVLVGATRPSEFLETWEDGCPFPPASDKEKVDSAVVLLRLDLDDERHLAVAHVLSDPGIGFAGAAALCAARHEYRSGAGSDRKPFRVRFERPAQ